MLEPDNIRTAVMRVAMLADELQALEVAVHDGLRQGTVDALGGVPGPVATTYRSGAFVCYRLPPLDPGRYQGYQTVFEEYLRRLSRAGIVTVVSEPRLVQREDGATVIYAVQAAVPDDRLGPAWVEAREPDDPAVRTFWDRVLTLVFASVKDGLGLDARLAHWCVPREKPQYVGLAVPLLRSPAGREELDVDVAFARAPKLLRRFLGSTVLERIRAPYYHPRTVTLDLVADLQRIGLDHHVMPLMLMANGRLARHGMAPITAAQIQARKRNAAGVDLLYEAMSKVDVGLSRLRGRSPRFLLPPE